MTGKEFLLQIRELSKIVRAYDEEYETLMARLTSITYRQKDINIMKSKEDTFPETVEKMAEIKKLLIEKLREFSDLRLKAEDMIRQVEDYRYQTVIIKFYFQAKTIEQVAVDMDISYRWVCDLKKDAVRVFEKIYEKSEKV